jgi:hypothetical protein
LNPASSHGSPISSIYLPCYSKASGVSVNTSFHTSKFESSKSRIRLTQHTPLKCSFHTTISHVPLINLLLCFHNQFISTKLDFASCYQIHSRKDPPTNQYDKVMPSILSLSSNIYYFLVKNILKTTNIWGRLLKKLNTDRYTYTLHGLTLFRSTECHSVTWGAEHVAEHVEDMVAVPG